MQTDAYITGGPFLTGPSTSCFVLAAQQARFEGRVRTVGINIDSVKSEGLQWYICRTGTSIWIDESDPHRFQYVNGCCRGL